MKKLITILLGIIISAASFAQSMEGVFYVTDEDSQFGRILPQGHLITDRTEGITWILTATTTATTYTLATWSDKKLNGGAAPAIDLNEVVVGTGSSSDGSPDLTWDGTILTVSGSVTSDYLELEENITPLATPGTIFYNDDSLFAIPMGSTVPINLMNSGSGASLTDYTGEQFLRDWPSNYVMTGGVESAFEYRFYATQTITCYITPSGPFEVGTSNPLTIYGSTINPDHPSNGEVSSTGVVDPLLPVFGTDESYSYSITFIPKEVFDGDYTAHTYSFQASQDYDGTETGTSYSTLRTVNAYYPVLYGISAVDYSSDMTGFYSDAGIEKIIEGEGDKTVDFIGTGYIYYAFPTTWSDETLSSILDINGFEDINSFTKYGPLNLTSFGLLFDWTTTYILYKYDLEVDDVDWEGFQFKQ